jgi:hypothetical protein
MGNTAPVASVAQATAPCVVQARRSLIAHLTSAVYAARDIWGAGKGPATLVPKGDRMATEAYCVKCRTKRTMKDEKAVTMKNGKPATQGICPECGTKMFKIGKSK